MSHQQLLAAQIFANFAAQFATPAPAPVVAARNNLTASQTLIVEAVANGARNAEGIMRKVGMTKRQTQTMIQGLLFAGVLTSRGGLAVA